MIADRRGHQPDVIRRAIQPLRVALQAAVDAEVFPANPSGRVRTPSVRHKAMRVLTVNQVETLAEAISHPVFKVAGNGASGTFRASS